MVISFSTILASRQARVYEELEEAHGHMVVLDKMKDEFLATTSHELRTPLHGIMGLTENMLTDILEPPPPEHRRSLELVQQSARHLTALVDGILDFSRLQAGRVDLYYENVNIDGLLQGMASLARGMVGNKPVEIRYNGSDTVPNIVGDRKRIEQIVLNLLSNAVKFTEEGSVTLLADVEDGGVAIRVRDTGRGIAEDRISRIWNPYEQLEPADSRRHGGAGLGLAITRYLTELHGGRVWAQSEYGRGSTFNVWLPLSPGQHRGVQVPPEKAKAVPPHVPGDETPLPEPVRPVVPQAPGGILVVDDDPVNMKIVVDILAGKGYRAQGVPDGPSALQAIGESVPDLVVLDIMLPGMSGYEVAKRIRSEFPDRHIPIIMVTARTQVEDMVRGFSFGGNDYITKPFSARELMVRIENQLVIRNFMETESRIKHHLAREKDRLQETLVERSRILNDAVSKLTEWERIIVQDLSLTRIFLDRLMSRRIRTKDIGYSLIYEPLYTVGGDVYDIHEYSPGRIRLFLADTTGHGITASLNTINIMTEYEILRDRDLSPAEIIEDLNARFYRKSAESRVYFTCCIAEINMAQHTLRFSSAGHPEQFMMHNGTVTGLKPKGPLIGFRGNISYEEVTHEFIPGSLLFLYTDGLLEDDLPAALQPGKERRALRDERYLKESLRECTITDPDGLLNAIKAAMKGETYMARRVTDDDLTMIALKIFS